MECSYYRVFFFFLPFEHVFLSMVLTIQFHETVKTLHYDPQVNFFNNVTAHISVHTGLDNLVDS